MCQQGEEKLFYHGCGDTRNQNIVLKEQVKINKYQDLMIEELKLWSIKATVIPVIIVALGTISNNLEKHMDKVGIPKSFLNSRRWSYLEQPFHFEETA